MSDGHEVEITTEATLREVLGTPNDVVRDKVRTVLDPLDVEWLAHSPFVLIGTSDADGRCDVSPKGDPDGIALVLDDHTVVVPERPGNHRGDGFVNILSNPHVGLLFLVPGRGDTLRVNGRARIVREAPYFDRMVVKGHRPILAMVVDVEEVFYHCQKAFMRSKLWQPDSWTPDALPNRAAISQALERPDDPIEELERYYGPAYAEGLYRA